MKSRKKSERPEGPDEKEDQCAEEKKYVHFVQM